MKKIFVYFAVLAAMIFVVSCGGGSTTGDNTDTGTPETDEDSADSGSTDTGTTEPTDTGTTEPTDTGEPDTAPDGGDSQPDDGDSEPDGDSGDSTSEPDEDNADSGDSASDQDTDPGDSGVPTPDQDAGTVEPTTDEDAYTPEPNDEDSVTPPIPDEDADQIQDLREEGLYLGIIGFNEVLSYKEIELLSSENENNYKTFIDALTKKDGTGLYYADYKALEMMRDYFPIPAKLENVALVTFTDGLDNISTNPLYNFNPENYDTKEDYRNAIHNMILNEEVHGKKVEAYTIGLKGGDVNDPGEFKDTLEKLASEPVDEYRFEVSDMEAVKERFNEIAKSLYSVSKMVNLDVKVPGGEDNGQRLRFTFDINCDRDTHICDEDGANSDLYIEATYRRSDITLVEISYNGFADGESTIPYQSTEGAFFHFVFNDVKYENDGKPLSDTDYNKINLWRLTSNGIWNHDSEFKPGNSSELIEDKKSALIMLVLDSTTSLGDKFTTMKQVAKDFVTTLVNGGTETQVSECIGLLANAQWNTASEITQTWNGTSWTPTTTGAYSETASTEKCYFKCASGYTWNGSQCVIPSNPCSPNPCSSISNSNGNCTVSGSSYVCGCNSGYDWTGSQCQSGSSGGSKSLGEICTNQTTCYNASSSMTCPSSSSADFYGQDAQYTSKCTAQSFSSSTNVVVDNNTGLTWEKSPSSSTYTWANRATHCNELNSSNYGGKSNWRVPNPLEFMTIVDNSTYNPATNSNFTNMPTRLSDYLWTSKEYGGDTSLARAFNPYYGWYSYGNSKTDNSYKVLCVSGNELAAATSSDFTTQTISGKVVVTDSKTGLMWQKEYETGKTWQQALKYCEDSTYAGYSDWRLPNKNELASLLDPGKSGAPYSNFPDMPSNYFWSSSTFVYNTTENAWYVYFNYGGVSNGGKTNNGHDVRCVR